mgnify:CR=1 FL=1
MVPAFKSDITGYVLVGLKDEVGNINLFRYDDSKEDYITYCQLAKDGVTLIPLESTKLIEGFNTKKEIKINNSDVVAFNDGTDSEFVLVYGMNASNGETGWYKYDTKEETFQRYQVLNDTVTKEEMDMYFILTIVFAALSFVSILLVIIILAMNSKLRKKNNKLISMIESSRKKEVVKETLEEKEVVEDSQEKEKDEGLSKREQRRIEKQKEQEQQDELRKMQEDFLKTEVNEIIVDDVELEDSAPVRKRGRKKK